MSKPKTTPTVVTNTASFNTVVESKISRKELVDMIIDEQEGALEDQLEAALERLNEARGTSHDAHNIFCKVLKKAILNKASCKTILKDAAVLFKKRKLTLSVQSNLNWSHPYSRCGSVMRQDVDKKREVKFNSFLYLEVNPTKTLDGSEITMGIFTQAQLMKLKGVKEGAKVFSDSQNEVLEANIDYNDVQNALNKFKKKGKRARSSFVRELMKNTAEGQAVLQQLDGIKESTQKLLKP